MIRWPQTLRFVSVTSAKAHRTRCDSPEPQVTVNTRAAAIDSFSPLYVCMHATFTRLIHRSQRVQAPPQISMAEICCDGGGRRCLFIRIICNQSGHRRQSMPIINQRRKPPVKMIIYTTRECGLCNTVHGARWDDSVVC